MAVFTRQNRHARVSETRADAAPEGKRRGLGVWWTFAGALVVLGAAIVAVAQNSQRVRLHYLAWNASVSLIVVVLTTALAAVLVDEVGGLIWRRRRRAKNGNRNELEHLRGRRAATRAPGRTVRCSLDLFVHTERHLMKRILLSFVVIVGLLAVGSGSALGQAARTTASPPTESSLPVISGTVQAGHTLTASSGTWGGVTPITYAYQWQQCNSSGTGCGAIHAATNQNYVLSNGDVGRTIRVQVTATNVDGTNQALSASTAAVVAVRVGAPVNTKQPNPSGTAKNGQTITVDDGTWSGQQPITFTYQWQSCTTPNPICTDLAGATGRSYLIGTSLVGSSLRATVTASNSAGKTSVFSNLTATVVATSTSPVNTSLPLISGSLSVGHTLQASSGVWTGLSTNPLAYQWSRCNANGTSCASISGATGKSYGVGNVDVGNGLRVSVTATNATGTTSAISASSAIVARVVQTGRFNAVLRAGQEVNGTHRTPSGAAGHFTAELTGKSLRWTLTFSHLSGRPTIAGLNRGLRGANGVAFKTLCRGCISAVHGTLTLTASQADTMLRGGTYVNIHTVRNRQGEIRGQLNRVS